MPGNYKRVRIIIEIFPRCLPTYRRLLQDFIKSSKSRVGCISFAKQLWTHPLACTYARTFAFLWFHQRTRAIVTNRRNNLVRFESTRTLWKCNFVYACFKHWLLFMNYFTVIACTIMYTFVRKQSVLKQLKIHRFSKFSRDIC